VKGTSPSFKASFGSEDPRTEVNIIPQREICDDIQNSLGMVETFGMSIDNRMSANPVNSSMIEINPMLEQVGHVLIAEVKSGNKKEIVTERGLLRTSSYPRMVKAMLMKRDVPTILTKNIRSGLLGRYMIGEEGRLGWTDVMRSKMITEMVLDEIASNWWDDVGVTKLAYSHSSGVVTSKVNRYDLLVHLKKIGLDAVFSWKRVMESEK
jgi:hypothetical protein